MQWLVATSGVSPQKCSEAGRRAPSGHMDVPNGAVCRLEASFVGLPPRQPYDTSESATSCLFRTVIRASGDLTIMVALQDSRLRGNDMNFVKQMPLVTVNLSHQEDGIKLAAIIIPQLDNNISSAIMAEVAPHISFTGVLFERQIVFDPIKWKSTFLLAVGHKFSSWLWNRPRAGLASFIYPVTIG